MEEGLHNCIYLTQTQLIWLLAAAGADSAEGIFRGDPSQILPQTLTQAAFSLCERGLLTVEDTDPGQEPLFIPNAYLASMIRHIAGCSSTRTVSGPQGLPRYMIYPGEVTVVVEACPSGEGGSADTDEGMLRLFELPEDEFLRWQKEMGDEQNDLG